MSKKMSTWWMLDSHEGRQQAGQQAVDARAPALDGAGVKSPQNPPPPQIPDTWRQAYMKRRVRAVSLNELRVAGGVAILAQVLVTITYPAVLYVTFYSRDPRLQFVPIFTWSVTAVAACLGIAGLAGLRPVVLGAHSVLAVALAAAVGGRHAGLHELMIDRCDRAQSSFKGCTSCACAAAGNCSVAALTAPSCAACAAWGTDLCAEVDLVLAIMAPVLLVAMALPAVFSAMVLMRLEKGNSDLANRVLYARALVDRECERLLDRQGLGVAPPVLRHMLATLLRHGGGRDEEAVRQCCALLGWRREQLGAEEWWDVDSNGAAPAQPPPDLRPVDSAYGDSLRRTAGAAALAPAPAPPPAAMAPAAAAPAASASSPSPWRSSGFDRNAAPTLARQAQAVTPDSNGSSRSSGVGDSGSGSDSSESGSTSGSSSVVEEADGGGSAAGEAPRERAFLWRAVELEGEERERGLRNGPSQTAAPQSSSRRPSPPTGSNGHPTTVDASSNSSAPRLQARRGSGTGSHAPAIPEATGGADSDNDPNAVEDLEPEDPPTRQRPQAGNGAGQPGGQATGSAFSRASAPSTSSGTMHSQRNITRGTNVAASAAPGQAAVGGTPPLPASRLSSTTGALPVTSYRTSREAPLPPYMSSAASHASSNALLPPTAAPPKIATPPQAAAAAASPSYTSLPGAGPSAARAPARSSGVLGGGGMASAARSRAQVAPAPQGLAGRPERVRAVLFSGSSMSVGGLAALLQGSSDWWRSAMGVTAAVVPEEPDGSVGRQQRADPPKEQDREPPPLRPLQRQPDAPPLRQHVETSTGSRVFKKPRHLKKPHGARAVGPEG